MGPICGALRGGVIVGPMVLTRWGPRLGLTFRKGARFRSGLDSSWVCGDGLSGFEKMGFRKWILNIKPKLCLKTWACRGGFW